MRRPPAQPLWLVAMLLLALPGGASAPAPHQGATQAPRQTAAPWRCGEKTYCTQMRSCEEAMFHFRSCGLQRLDGDRDGVPCEALCGQGRRGGSTRRR